MPKMQQAHTDYGTRGESGEREPKGAADVIGRKVGVPKEDRESGKPGLSGERSPGSKASDASGERKAKIEGGVGMGKADDLGKRSDSHAGKHDGRTGEFNTGRHEGSVYSHERHKHGFTHKG